MTQRILKDEWNELQRLLVIGTKWIPIIKYIRQVTGLDLKESKGIVDKYKIGTGVDSNLMSEFETITDDIDILRKRIRTQIKEVEDAWTRVGFMVREVNDQVQAAAESILNEIEDCRRRYEPDKGGRPKD